MKVEATAQEIRRLLQLAALDAQEQELPPGTYQARRKASRNQVSGALLEPYEALLEASRYPAIVPIERGNCSGCHVRLPTMIEYQAGRSPSVHRCPHCRRMVYAPQHLAGQGSQDSRATVSKKKAASRRGAPASARERT